MTCADRIVALAKQIQDDGYGDIHLGRTHWQQEARTIPAHPFVVLGLLMAVEVLDGNR